MNLTYGEVLLLVGQRQDGPIMYLQQQRLPPRAALKLKRIIRELAPLFDDLTSERNELIRKHGENGQINPNMEGFEAFSADDKILLETTAEITVDKLTIADLGDIPISAMEIDLLEPILEE